jgi:hypothetical protein
MKFPFIRRRTSTSNPLPELEDRAPDPPNLAVEMCQRHVIRVGGDTVGRELVTELVGLGYHTLTKPAESGTDWLVIAYRWITSDELGGVYDEMTRIAESVDGEWEESIIPAVR